MIRINKNNAQHIPHNRPTFGSEEEEAALRVLRSGWVAQGIEVDKFEDEFCNFLAIPKGSAVAVSSGTAALYVSLLALKAKEKTVAYPLYTCSALRNAITLAGGESVLIDSSMTSPNINISAINRVEIAIIPHLYGIPQDLSTYNGIVIEDCAQSLGATVNNVPVGLQGNIGIFSFFATKLITTGGQGGMVVSTDHAIIDFIKDFRTFDQRTDHKQRFNFQMTDLQAAIGRVQLQKFPHFLKRRREIYDRYINAGLPLLNTSGKVSPVPFRAILKSEKQHEVINELAKNNIKAVIPIKREEMIGLNENFPNALYWEANTVSLPIYPTLTAEEVDRVILAVSKVLSV